MCYKHLNERERFYIEKALRKKVSVSQIAKDLGRCKQTIYNEIKRGTVLQTDGTKDFKVYCYDSGQRVYRENRARCVKQIKLSADSIYLQDISHWIKKQRYSPQAAWYKVGGLVSIRTIYNYVYRGIVPNVTIFDLPYARPKKKREKQRGKRICRGTSIELRPEHIKERKEYGHWEMDTVYSSKDDLHCLLVLSERKTRKEIVIRMKDRTSLSMIKALDRLERSMGSPAFRNTFKTITCDNGVEFADFDSIERSCRMKGKRTKVFYCHPYSSCERGTNENINRMIRRWIPKGDDIGLWSPAEIHSIQEWINNYPRPMFNGKSSNEYLACCQLAAPLEMGKGAV